MTRVPAPPPAELAGARPTTNPATTADAPAPTLASAALSAARRLGATEIRRRGLVSL